jgi:hypothetical protein
MRRASAGAKGAGRVGRQVILDDPDALGVGIMDIGEFAHALGVVFGCAPLGDWREAGDAISESGLASGVCG